jgi:hypothetical protein
VQLCFRGGGKKLFIDVEAGVLSLDGQPLAEVTEEGFLIGSLLFGDVQVTELTALDEAPPVAEPIAKPRRGRPRKAPVASAAPEPDLPVYSTDGEDDVQP